jgi:hypothetical protein
MKFAFDLISLLIGVAIGGALAAASAKFLGFFQKQDASIAKKV